MGFSTELLVLQSVLYLIENPVENPVEIQLNYVPGQRSRTGHACRCSPLGRRVLVSATQCTNYLYTTYKKRIQIVILNKREIQV